jgi:hypothetical protein
MSATRSRLKTSRSFDITSPINAGIGPKIACLNSEQREKPTLRARIDEHFARFDVILDVPLEIEDVALRRSIVAQSDFVSAFQNHHVFNELRSGTLARICYARTHERQPVGCIRISEHTDL